jgi:hypothetical protein
VWSLGTLGIGTGGTIVIRGRFVTLFDMSPAITNAQISGPVGAAFASEVTGVQPLPTLTRLRLLLKQSPNQDLLRVGALFSVAGGLNLSGQEIAVSIVNPAGGTHTDELVLPRAQPTPRGRWKFTGEIPGAGFVRLTMRGQGDGAEWRFRVTCQGPDILPPFPAGQDFQVILRIGSSVFLSDVGTFRESVLGTNRVFP